MQIYSQPHQQEIKFSGQVFSSKVTMVLLYHVNGEKCQAILTDINLLITCITFFPQVQMTSLLKFSFTISVISPL